MDIIRVIPGLCPYISIVARKSLAETQTETATVAKSSSRLAAISAMGTEVIPILIIMESGALNGNMERICAICPFGSTMNTVINQSGAAAGSTTIAEIWELSLIEVEIEPMHARRLE